MEENWVVAAKKADFNAIGKELGVDPVIVRIMRNRGLTDISEMRKYLTGGREDLHDPHLLKDADRTAQILGEKISRGRRIRIIGDYDIDGIMSTYIFFKALRRVGANVDYVFPERVRDGYGINENLVTQAAEDGIDTILTCDNGIAAINPIRLAKELGMTALVTDHHEIPHEGLPEADAIVNAKQSDCPYPFKELCGSAVAFKVTQVLYEQEGIAVSEADEFLEFAGFATVGDIVDLVGENRILAKLALQMLRHTKNAGMRALIREKNVRPDRFNTYIIGFVLGPCFNASGRLETAQKAMDLILCSDPAQAEVLARELAEINETRKDMTEKAQQQAMGIIEAKGYDRDKVIVVYMPDCHESLAGLVAGRIREAYNRPAFVVTRGIEDCKGSARSIEKYSMYEEMCKCGELFTKFGGHPMAAGFSLKEENIDVLRKRLNELTTLTEEDLIPKVVIDAVMPIDYISFKLLEQLEEIEPCGKGNASPLFADRNLEIVSLQVGGKKKPVIRMRLRSSGGRMLNAVYFGDIENLRSALEKKYDKLTADDTIRGRCTHHASLHFTYSPTIDDYYPDERRIELRINGIKA